MEKIKKFSRNKVLTAILLLAITFSVVTVVLGVSAVPNPGHDISTLGGYGATGDLLYGTNGTSGGVSALADIATGNALISGGAGLTTHISGILPTANGGTGIAYFTAAGPTVARTYTFPDANATILTGNSAVTVAQGGTGLATLTTGNVILGAGASNVTFVSPATNGNVLTANGTTWVSQAPSGGGAPTGATYITQTADATLSAEQALSTLATGYMKVANSTGVITSQAVPIPVSDGGTGATTLTTGNVILGAGASAPTFVAPGTSGNLLQSNGTTWTSAAPTVRTVYNQSVAAQGPGFAAETYVIGSSFTIPSTGLRVGTR